MFAVASNRAKSHLQAAVAEDPELRRVLDAVERRELDPLTAVQTIMQDVFRVGSDTTGLTAATTPSIADIEAARERLAGVARETPVYPTETFSRLTGRQVFLKAENLQRTGSFKIRGAYNTIATLGAQERRAGVVAASAGNHGQAVAWAARGAGIPATIFMPQDAPMAKVEATRSYGGTTELTGGEAFEEAVAAASAYVEARRATLVHAFEDARVIAGQGRSGSSSPSRRPTRDGADPDRRRRTRRGHRHGAEGAAPRGSDRRCPVSAGIHDRGRDRRETPRRARVLDPRACPRRHGLRLGRRDLGGARALRRADEVPGGGCGRRRARRAAGRSRAGAGSVAVVLSEGTSTRRR